jgi:hypothetical protein
VTGAGDPRVAYCTLEAVRDALDIAPSAAAARRLSRAIYAVSGGIEGLLNRRFYPHQDTRYFDWPLNYQYAQPWRLWLDANEAWSVDSITTGGQTLHPGVDFILRPENMGPPYSHIEILVSGHAMWAPGTGTWQQAVGVTGVFGGCGDTEAAGATGGSVDAATTTLLVSDSAAVGTLDTIRVDTEWMTVTRKSMTPSGAALAADMTGHQNGTVVTVTGGTWREGETILVDGERARIDDAAGTHLVVRRAVDGTTLAPHTTGAPVYVQRACTVARGVLGSTAAAHTAGTAVERLAVPDLVGQLAIAETLADTELQTMGYTSQKGEDGRAAAMRELADLRNRTYTRWARQSRIRAV